MKQAGTVATLIASLGARELPAHEREVLEVLRRRGGKMWALELISICKADRGLLSRLADQGYLSLSEVQST